MTTYYSDTFDGDCTPPALPSKWSTYLNGGSAATSTAAAHSGTVSLAVSVNSNGNQAMFWQTGVTDGTHGCTVIDGWFQWTGTQPQYINHSLMLRAQSVPSSTNMPQSYLVTTQYGSGTANHIQIDYTNGTGSFTTIASVVPSNMGSLFVAGTWYRTIFQARDVEADGTSNQHMIVFTVFFQRSDGCWLVTNGSSAAAWTNTGVPTAALTCNNYAASVPALDAGLAVWSCGGGTGNIFYWDNLSFYDYPYININTLPTWNPGNSAELGGSYTGTGTGLANLYDGNYDSYFVSTSTWESTCGIDLGSGNSAVLTRVWLSPRTDNAYEHIASDILVEGSNDTTGTTWTSLGTSCDEACNRYAMIPLTITPGSAYRYFRCRVHEWSMMLGELYFEGQPAGSTTWKPVRPTLTPPAGKYANGAQSIAMTTPTSGSSIYYTTDGTIPALSGGVPQGTTTLYSAPVPLASNNYRQVIKAIAYNASGTSATTSAVTTGTYGTPQQYVADTGIAGGPDGFSSTMYWCEDLFDNRGWLTQIYPFIYFDPTTQLLWLCALNYNSVNAGESNGVMRRLWLYSSSDYYNWTYVCSLPILPRAWTTSGQTGSPVWNYGRGGIYLNPSPIHSYNKYVYICSVNVSSNGHGNAFGGFCTAPSMSGPWVWRNFASPSSTTGCSDNCILVDQDGTVYHIYNNGNATPTGIWALKVDPTTDYTSYTGSPIQIDDYGNTGSFREGPAIFYYQGGQTGGNATYFMLSSAATWFGSTNSDMRYKAITGTSLANVASAWNSASTWTPLWNNIASPHTSYNMQTGGATYMVGARGSRCRVAWLILANPRRMCITVAR